MATPACGNKVKPKYFLTFSEALETLAPRYEPASLPIILNTIYTIPIKPTDLKTERFNSAPEAVKKATYKAGVNLSAIVKAFLKFGITFTIVAPNIIQERSDDKLNLREIAAVANTMAMINDISSVSPSIFLINRIRNTPIISPNARAAITSNIGITSILNTEIVPVWPTKARAGSSYPKGDDTDSIIQGDYGNNVFTTSLWPCTV